MASAYNLTVGISLAILLAILLGLLGVGVWRQLTRQMTRVGLVVFLIGAGIATVEAQKRLAPRQAADGGDEPVARESPDEDCDTENSHSNLWVSAIAVTPTNVEVVASWPEGFFSGDVTMDILAAWPALTNDWRWIKSVIVPDGHTNELVNLAPSDLMMTNLPSALFVRVLERNSAASTMDDFDNDGLPGFYELHYGTNPYVADSGSIRKLTVGADGDYPSIETALAASTNYSVISLGAGIHGLTKILDMPDHPVMIEGPSDGYAILQSDQSVAAFVLKSGEGRQTVFRNLIVDMRCRKDFQAAFWIGGNTPWTGRGASATFENVRVRANYPGTEYFGWQFYRDDGGPSLLKDCVMNAAGSTWAYGVSMYNAASNVIENCAFVNMPTNAGESTALAVFARKSGEAVEVREAPEESSLTWAGYSRGGIYGPDVDSDGDGRSDYEEIFMDDTDPWLADSDGDGMTDWEELQLLTDPRDVASHQFNVTVSVTNTVCYSDTTNYVFLGTIDQWKSNFLCSGTGAGFVTNRIMQASTGGVAGAFVDVDRDGEFDPSKDVLQMVDVLSWLSQITLRFTFGDMDGDKVEDVIELSHGAKYSDRRDFCFSLTLNEPVNWPTNKTVWLSFDGEIFNLTTNFSVHCHVTNGVLPQLVASNDEYCVRFDCGVSSHEVKIASLDSDQDGLPDLWELAAGLCPTNGADVIADNDGDGLINLHEYWAGTEPRQYDGTNTLLSVLTTSVMNRTFRMDSPDCLEKFDDYIVNSKIGVFSVKTNFWMSGVDTSCASMWNSTGGNQRAGTLVSPRHIVLAEHFKLVGETIVKFMGVDGVVYENKIDLTTRVLGTDIWVASLVSNMPSQVSCASLLPSNYVEYISSGIYLPVVCFNQNEELVLWEVCMPLGVSQWGEDSVCIGEPTVGGRSVAYKYGQVGDSGNPVFSVLNDQIVLLGCGHTGSSLLKGCGYRVGQSPFLTAYADQLQEAMDSLNKPGQSRETLRFLDFSRFQKLSRGN